MATILFVAFMLFLIKFSTERFWYFFVLILGIAVQLGYQLGIGGLLIWIGLGKVAHDIIYAGRES